MDAPKPFDFRNGGGDLLVKLTDHHCGWTNTTVDMKVTAATIVLLLLFIREFCFLLTEPKESNKFI